MIQSLDPSDFGVSSKSGFLSPDAPAKSFNNPYYKPWDIIIPNLPDLIRTKQLDAEINKLPLLSTDKLKDEVEYRRAYVILAFLAHAHVWQNIDAPNEKIPPQISEPFLEVSKLVGRSGTQDHRAAGCVSQIETPCMLISRETFFSYHC